MIATDDPKKLESALGSMYNRLVDFLIKSIDLNRVSTILEAGCGSGGLTIPLAEKLGAKRKIIAFDVSSGPYKGDLEILEKTIRKKGFERIIETIGGGGIENDPPIHTNGWGSVKTQRTRWSSSCIK